MVVVDWGGGEVVGGIRDDIDRDPGHASEMQSCPPACAADGSEDLPHVGPPGQLRLHLRKLRPDPADETQQAGGKRVQPALFALLTALFLLSVRDLFIRHSLPILPNEILHDTKLERDFRTNLQKIDSDDRRHVCASCSQTPTFPANGLKILKQLDSILHASPG